MVVLGVVYSFVIFSDMKFRSALNHRPALAFHHLSVDAVLEIDSSGTEQIDRSSAI